MKGSTAMQSCGTNKARLLLHTQLLRQTLQLGLLPKFR